MSGARASSTPQADPPLRRLLPAAPEVFFGSEARAVLDGTPGLLHGEKRHGHVDVFGLRPVAGTLRELVAMRLDGVAMSGWPVVGVAVRSGDLPEAVGGILRELVAGDLVVEGRLDRILVHCGDALLPCRVDGQGSRRKGS